MKISNFRKIDDKFYVDVTTGFWIFKETVVREVACEGSWFYVDTGDWCEGWRVEALERAWKLKEENK